MKLEEEIRQKQFKNEYHKLGVNIIYTANWLGLHHYHHCREFDITPEQFNILRILRGQHPKPATVNLLMERMLNKMSNASRLVDKLEKKKLVLRETCKDDRRACDVLITGKGLALLREMDTKEREWIKLIAHIPQPDAKRMNELLDKIRKNNNKQ